MCTARPVRELSNNAGAQCLRLLNTSPDTTMAAMAVIIDSGDWDGVFVGVPVGIIMVFVVAVVVAVGVVVTSAVVVSTVVVCVVTGMTLQLNTRLTSERSGSLDVIKMFLVMSPL